VQASKTVPRLSPAEWQTLVDDGYLDSAKPGRAILLTATNQAWSWAEQAESVELEKFESPAGAAALEALLNRLLPLLRERGIGLAELFANDPPPTPPIPPAPRIRKKTTSKTSSRKKAKTKKALAKKKARKKVNAKEKAQAKSAKRPKPKETPRSKAKPGKAKRPSATRSTDERLTPAPSLPERIERACLTVTHGARQTRVKLTDLRANLRDVAREDLDSALLKLQREKKLVLYREDNSAALRTEDHEAALFVGNEPRHLVLLEA